MNRPVRQRVTLVVVAIVVLGVAAAIALVVLLGSRKLIARLTGAG